MNGYWQIPDAQAGLKNEALKPYIQFDFRVNKRLKTWRIHTCDGCRPANGCRGWS
jgi:hypothetical protein